MCGYGSHARPSKSEELEEQWTEAGGCAKKGKAGFRPDSPFPSFAQPPASVHCSSSSSENVERGTYLERRNGGKKKENERRQRAIAEDTVVSVDGATLVCMRGNVVDGAAESAK